MGGVIMVGKWYKYIGPSHELLTKGKWYKLINEDKREMSFLDNENDELSPYNYHSPKVYKHFDFKNPMDHNPDELNEVKKQFQIKADEALELNAKLDNNIETQKNCDTITIVLFPDGTTNISTTLDEDTMINELTQIAEVMSKKTDNLAQSFILSLHHK